MARLAGIEMKRPFADAVPIVGPSETLAQQQWLLDQRFLSCLLPNEPAFDAMRSNPAYELTANIYRELQRQGDWDTRGKNFGSFLHNNHS